MKHSRPYQPSNHIQVEVNGKTYSGSYTYEPPIVHVSSEYGAGPIRADQNPEAWAKQLLREFVRKWLAQS